MEAICEIFKPAKIRLSSCVMTKIPDKRIGVVKKHCSTFMLFSSDCYPQIVELLYCINKRLNVGWTDGGSAKIKKKHEN